MWYVISIISLALEISLENLIEINYCQKKFVDRHNWDVNYCFCHIFGSEACLSCNEIILIMLSIILIALIKILLTLSESSKPKQHFEIIL